MVRQNRRWFRFSVRAASIVEAEKQVLQLRIFIDVLNRFNLRNPEFNATEIKTFLNVMERARNRVRQNFVFWFRLRLPLFSAIFGAVI